MPEIKNLEELSDKEKEIVSAALAARQEAYCPYSDYAVGAAVISQGGNTYIGWNAETVTFNQSVHAEQNAIFRMPKDDRKIKMLAFASSDGGAPCGHCRQIISEFAAPDTKIIGYSVKDKLSTVTKLSEIFPLPMPTGPGALTD